MPAPRLLPLVALALLIAPAFASPAGARVPCLHVEDDGSSEIGGDVTVCALAVSRTDAPTGMSVTRRPLYVEGDLHATDALAWRGTVGWNATQQGPVSDETRVTYAWIGSDQAIRFDNGLMAVFSAHNVSAWQDGAHGPAQGSRDYRNETAVHAAAIAEVSVFYGLVRTGDVGTHHRATYESVERQHDGGWESRTCATFVDGERYNCPTLVRIPSLIFLTP